MTRKYIAGALTLAATIFVVGQVHAAELTLPGEPEFDYKVDASCDLAMRLDEPLAKGRVVAVDAKSGRITLEFQPILPLLPEGGKRVFRVEDRAALEGLAPGDKVRFEVERAGRSYTVTRIENSN
jgi:Cu/Ag efflux protein CusF